MGFIYWCRMASQNNQRHCVYSMRFFKHTGLKAAWDMRVGGMLFLLCCGQVLFVLLS
jgi:hypothetical protein